MINSAFVPRSVSRLVVETIDLFQLEEYDVVVVGSGEGGKFALG